MPPPPAPSGAKALALPLEQDGYGCALEVRGEPSEDLARYLAKMKALTAIPLLNISATWTYLTQARRRRL